MRTLLPTDNKTDAKTVAQLELPTHLTASQCKQAIYSYHARGGIGEWVVFDEFMPYTGGGVNRIDMFAVGCWQSSARGSHASIAYEVKVSRGDFIREVRQPAKRRLALLWSNYFNFVCPVGLLAASEIPVECGLLEVMPDLTLKHTVAAPYRERMPPSWAFVAA